MLTTISTTIILRLHVLDVLEERFEFLQVLLHVCGQAGTDLGEIGIAFTTIKLDAGVTPPVRRSGGQRQDDAKHPQHPVAPQ
jgi:hypothetical protein